MRFSSDDVQRFAAWSADRNPLHVDEDFARQTHFGRTIVHGVLTALEAWRMLSVPTALTSKSVNGSVAAQSWDGCAAAWMISSV